MLTGGALRAYSTHSEAPAELFYFNAPTKWEKLTNIMIDTFGIEQKEKQRRLVQGGSKLECFKEFYDHMAGTELLQVAVLHLQKLHREDQELWQKTMRIEDKIILWLSGLTQ